MDKPKYKKLTFEFPAEEYVYLKMACAKKGLKMKDFLTEAVIRGVEDLEDEYDRESLKAGRLEASKGETVSWEEMEKTLGWDKL